MAHKRSDGTSFTDITTLERYDGSAWVAVSTVKRYDGSAWVDTGWGGGGGGALSATASPGSVDENIVIPDEDLASTVISDAVTVTAAGGTAPYTYAWSRMSGSSSVAVTSPTAATTTFEAVIYRGLSRSAVFRCTVTDAAMDTATVDVSVSLSR